MTARPATPLANTGRDCLLVPSHGASVVIRSRGRDIEWCPHSGHTAPKRTTPALLYKQQEYLDAEAAKAPTQERQAG